MRFEIFLAIRYLRTPRRHRLAQFTALAAIVGIAMGVAAMILAQAAANGFRQAMQNKILANTAHITVFSVDGADIADWQKLQQQIEEVASVTAVSATSFDNALLVGKTNSAFAHLRGVQSQKSKVKSQKSEDEQSAIRHPPSAIQIEIGKDLAQKTGLSVGDTAQIVTGSESADEASAPTSTTVEVGGVFATGLYEYDSTWVRAALDDAAKLTGKSGINPVVAAAALEIKIADVYRSNQIAGRIRERLGANYQVLDWQEANRPLFAALSLERRAGVLIVSLLVLIAALNIATTLALVVGERKFDIAVLKTCGARTGSIVLIFLLEGVLLGAIGIICGVVLGLAACFASNRLGWMNLPPDVYSIENIILEPGANEILLTIAAAFLLCLTASTFPAWTAAKVKPAANLQKN